MYLTDLAFIEEGTPNYTEDNLVNFSKMRMVKNTSVLCTLCWFWFQSVCLLDVSHLCIKVKHVSFILSAGIIWFYIYFFPIFICLQISHIIREIRQFQQTAYKIDHQPKVRFVFWLHPNPNPEFGGISSSGRAVHYCLPVNLLIKYVTILVKTTMSRLVRIIL